MTTGNSFWTPDSLRAAAGGGRWLHRPLDSNPVATTFAGLSTDSRSVTRGQVFLALKGDHFDGHSFLDDAVRHGAGMLIVQTAPADIGRLPADSHVLLVDDTLKALARLASAYRRALKGTRFVAVTGSSGKTTTKQMLRAVLGEQFRVSASPRSFNNHVGVPLTILASKGRDQYVICEVGTNHPGEIAQLGSIIEPDIGVITGIGRVHLEGLGSIEGVANEKASLLASLAHGGWAAVNIDETAILPHLEQMERGITFGFSTDADLRISDCKVDAEGTEFSLNDRSRWRIGLLGQHHASNATAAIAVGRRCGLNDDVIQAGLLKVEPPEMRFVRSMLDEIVLYDDSYNANPESMAASISTFRQLSSAADRRVVILGDMLELGSHSERAHRDLASLLTGTLEESEAPIDLAMLIGPESLALKEQLGESADTPGCVYFGQLDASALTAIVRALSRGDHILVKGSRGMHLERVVNAIRDRFPPRATRTTSDRATSPT